jgi:hypothetical protein
MRDESGENMLPARTYSVSIRHEWRALYERIWRPEFFSKWASGLSESELHQDGDTWVANGPEGPIRVQFTDHNVYGVMDHFVDAGDGNISIYRCALYKMGTAPRSY